MNANETRGQTNSVDRKQADVTTQTGLTHLPLDKMAAISQTIFFKCIFGNEKFRNLIKISLKFLRVQMTITQQWLRWWLGVEKATSHYLNQCWPDSLTHICGTRGKWVNTSRPGQNGRHLPDILKLIFLNEILWISIICIYLHWSFCS